MSIAGSILLMLGVLIVSSVIFCISNWVTEKMERKRE